MRTRMIHILWRICPVVELGKRTTRGSVSVPSTSHYEYFDCCQFPLYYRMEGGILPLPRTFSFLSAAVRICAVLLFSLLELSDVDADPFFVIDLNVGLEGGGRRPYPGRG